MNKFIFTLSILLFSANFIIAQEESVDDEVNFEVVHANAPAISFDETTIDYGTINQGDEPYRSFKFTNTGEAPLIIKNAKGSCGCTVPEWPKKPILPGESDVIKVKYDTNRIGNFRKTVRLTTNAVDEQVVLTIKGEVLKKEEPKTMPTKEGNMMIDNNG